MKRRGIFKTLVAVLLGRESLKAAPRLERPLPDVTASTDEWARICQQQRLFDYFADKDPNGHCGRLREWRRKQGESNPLFREGPPKFTVG